MIDMTQCFLCGLFLIAIYGFFRPGASMIRWLMAIEIVILAATTEILLAGYAGKTAPQAQVVALFWMTFAAVELAIGLAFVRCLSEQGESLDIAHKPRTLKEE